MSEMGEAVRHAVNSMQHLSSKDKIMFAQGHMETLYQAADGHGPQLFWKRMDVCPAYHRTELQMHAAAREAKSAGKSTVFEAPPKSITEPLAVKTFDMLSKKDVPCLLFEGAVNKRQRIQYLREKTDCSYFEIPAVVLEQALVAFQHSSLVAADLLFSFSGTWNPVLVIQDGEIKTIEFFQCSSGSNSVGPAAFCKMACFRTVFGNALFYLMLTGCELL